METKTLSFTLPVDLADKLEQALQADHVKLEEIAVGWLFFGRGIAEPGATRFDDTAIAKPAVPPEPRVNVVAVTARSACGGETD
jgi:hypothetical protein